MLILKGYERKYLINAFNHTKIKNWFFVFDSKDNEFIFPIKLGCDDFPDFNELDSFCKDNKYYAIAVACFLEKDKTWYDKPLYKQIDDIYNLDSEE